MKIECPNCGAAGRIDLSKRPANVNTVKCRSCQTAIPLDPVPFAAPAIPAVNEPIGTNSFQAAPPPELSHLTKEPDIVSGVEAVGTIPLDVPPAPATFSSQDPPVPRTACALCRENFPRTEMVRFGPDLVCAACKPTYVDMLQQGVSKPGELRYAGFWIRFAAKFLDGIILGVVGMVISFVLGMGIGGEPGAPAITATIISNLLQIILATGYTMYFLSSHRATPGKMACRLVVVTPEGENISAMRALGRCFAEWLSSIILGIGYLMAAFDEEKRTLHDRICNTRVAYK